MYAVILHTVDDDRIELKGVINLRTDAYGQAIKVLQDYIKDLKDFDFFSDLYFSTVYSLNGDTGEGISLMARGESTNEGEIAADRHLADVWILK